MVAEASLDYGGPKYETVIIFEFRDDKIARETAYWSEAFDAPAWRAQWVENPSGQSDNFRPRQQAAFSASTTVSLMSLTIPLSLTPNGPGGYVKDMETCREPSALETEKVPYPGTSPPWP